MPADPRDAELLRADIIPDAERSRQRPSACWVVPLPPYTPLMKGAAHSDMGGFDAGPDPGCALEVHVFPRFSEESPDGGTGLPRARNSDLEEVGRIVALIWTFMAASNVCMKAGDREGAFQLHRAAIEAMDKGSTSSAVMRCPRSYGQMSVCTPAWNAEEEDPDAELDSSERTMAAMFKRHAMGEKFYLRLDLARGMAESAMEMGNMDLALENVREVSSMLRHMTPERWPPTGLQLLLQGRMETDPAVALKLFREAMETLGAVVPVDGSIARELRESLVHYQREVQKA